jgi:hypothetical protein
MSANFELSFTKNSSNLQITLSGDFDGSSAWELVNTLHEHYVGQDRIIIDARNLGQIHPFGRHIFTSRLDAFRIPPHRLSFKGEKSHEIAPEGSRIFSNRHKASENRRGIFRQDTASSGTPSST